MIERFLIAWPDAPGEWREVDRWPDTRRGAHWETFERLDGITRRARRATVQTRGRRVRACRSSASMTMHGMLSASGAASSSAPSGRRAEAGGRAVEFRHHVPALALALHVIDGGTRPVTLPSTLRALTLAEYFESHARRLHSSGRRMTGSAHVIDKAGRAARPFTARDVYRNQWAAERSGAVAERSTCWRRMVG